MAKRLSTTVDVIAALGGIQAVADLTARKYTAAHNWKKAGRFPANTYVALTRELGRLGLTAPDSLWDQAVADNKRARA
jgi:hypothetical protein